MSKYEVKEGSLLLEPNTRIGEFKDSLLTEEQLRDDFKQLVQEGDELKSWSWYGGPLFARGGVCIVRDGKPVYAYGVWMS